MPLVRTTSCLWAILAFTLAVSFLVLQFYVLPLSNNNNNIDAETTSSFLPSSSFSSSSSFPTLVESLNRRLTLTHICKCSLVEMNDLVWSHRAKTTDDAGRLLEDGSLQATALLLSQGVSKFDVDVSLQPGVAGSDRFIVAHPTALEQANTNRGDSPFQTLSAFLSQVDASTNKHGQRQKQFLLRGHGGAAVTTVCNHLPHSFVTVEPKFDSASDIRDLIELLSRSPMAAQTAVIATTRVVLDIIEETHTEVRMPYIAVAFKTPGRSRNPAKDLPWQTPVMLHPHPLPHLKALPSLLRDRTRHQVIMPAISLLEPPLLRQERSAYGDINSNNNDGGGGGGGDVVVPWIVDDESTLMKALGSGVVNGIITNYPTRQIALLRDMHQRHC